MHEKPCFDTGILKLEKWLFFYVYKTRQYKESLKGPVSALVKQLNYMCLSYFTKASSATLWLSVVFLTSKILCLQLGQHSG